MINEEGPPEQFFNESIPSNVGSNPNQEGLEIDRCVFSTGKRNEDIKFDWNQGLAVDDDNKHAPMNIPKAQVTLSHIFNCQSWDFDV